MQENRSFDDYFGAVPGVRGFADRHQSTTKPESITIFSVGRANRGPALRAEGFGELVG